MSATNIAMAFIAWLVVAWAPLLQAAEPIQVEETAWARETPPGVVNGAAYVTLTNQGADTDRLVAARGTVSERIELHTHLLEGEVMTMRQVESIPLEPGARTVLQPGGDHLMLIGLTQPLVAGERFPLTLEFEKAGPMTVEFDVRRP
ncbi:MAG: copper chaperone PCu(A)C [Gammaproteobacteria bacterium]